MRVGITGGSGNLGRYIIQSLLDKGLEPVVISRSKASHLNVSTIQTNYTKNDLVEKLKGIDSIIHLAADRGAGGEFNKYSQTIEMTQNIYEACKELGINKIVFASTISVYSNQKNLPWNEEQLPSADTMYGISKYTCEMIGNKYSNSYGLVINNLRFAHLFGFNEKNNYMINLFMRKAFNQSPITLNTSSDAKREFLYMKDAAEATVKALYLKDSNTLNIGNKNNIYTNEEIGFCINKVFQNEGNLWIENPQMPDTSTSSFMDDKLSKKVLNFRPKYDLHCALTEIYEQMKELPDVPERY